MTRVTSADFAARRSDVIQRKKLLVGCTNFTLSLAETRSRPEIGRLGNDANALARFYGAGAQPGSSGPGESDVSVVSSGKL